MKKIVKSLLILLVALTPSFLVYSINPQHVEAKVCPIGVAAVKSSNGNFNCDDAQPTKENGTKSTGIGNWKTYLGKFAMAVAGLSVGLAVLMTVYAGYLYTISEGDAEKIKKAKFHLIMAGGGMMISLLAFVINEILGKIMS